MIEGLRAHFEAMVTAVEVVVVRVGEVGGRVDVSRLEQLARGVGGEQGDLAREVEGEQGDLARIMDTMPVNCPVRDERGRCRVTWG